MFNKQELHDALAQGGKTSMTNLWNKPEFQEKMQAIYDRFKNDPEYAYLQSLRVKMLWCDPAYVELRTKLYEAYWTEDKKQEASEHAKRGWQDPEYRKRQAAFQQQRSQEASIRRLAKIREKDQERVARANERKAQCIQEIERLSSMPKMHGIPRAVLCISTGKKYNTAVEAERDLSLSSGSVTRVCRGETKTAKGFVFAYIETK
jgi:hypothetical protein